MFNRLVEFWMNYLILVKQAASLYAVQEKSWFPFHPKRPKKQNESWVGPDNKNEQGLPPRTDNAFDLFYQQPESLARNSALWSLGI